jgi:uncharacterized protein YutE (UPF0331/DUF86 family)
MNVDKERVERYLFEIKSRHREIEELLLQSSDASLLEAPWILRGLKYCLIEIAEAMANVLQHILAKEMGEPVTGYVDTVIRAGQRGRGASCPNLFRSVSSLFLISETLGFTGTG